jgi:hypothetical protein
MSASRFADYTIQGNLAYEQRISKEERVFWPEDDRRLNKSTSRGGDAASVRSTTSTTTSAVNARLERLERKLEEEREGRQEVKAQLDRLQDLVVAHLQRQRGAVPTKQ